MSAVSRAERRPAGVGLEAVWVCGVVGLIALGSLTPFAYDASRIDAGWLLRPDAWSRFKAIDALVNFAVYLPVGAVLATAALRVARRFAATLVALFAAASLSYALETTQSSMAERYASGFDLVLNALGGLVGAALAVRVAPVALRCARGLARLVHGRRLDSSSRVVPAIWLALAAAIAWNGAIGVMQWSQGAALQVEVTPFLDYFEQPVTQVSSAVGRIAGLHVMLGAATCLVMLAVGRSARGLVAFITLAAWVFGAVSVNGRASASDVVVAGFALCVGIAWVYRIRAHVALLAAAEFAEKAETTEERTRLALEARRRAFGARTTRGITLTGGATG